MKFLALLYVFIANVIYMAHMTFIEGGDFDFEMLPFGTQEACE